MKRFLLFGGSTYYPSGGWHDYEGDFDTVNDAMLYANKEREWQYDWWHIVDTETGRPVRSRDTETGAPDPVVDAFVQNYLPPEERNQDG